MKKEKKSLHNTPPVDHSGHRQRLKSRVQKDGLANFEMHNILELLLFYTIPRADTNEIGHRLLQEFGSFANVLNATPEALMRVHGIGRESALFLHMLPQVFRIYEESARKTERKVKDLSDIANYISPYFVGLEKEVLYVVCLNAKNVIIKSICTAEGHSSQVDADIRRIVSEVLNCNAAGVVLAHNHPSGILQPSTDDYKTTRRIADALNAIDVPLLDHLIFAEDRFEPLSKDIRFNSVFGTAFRTASLKLAQTENENPVRIDN